MSWSGCTITSNTDTTSTSGVGGSGASTSSNTGGDGGIGVGAAGGTGGTGTGGTGTGGAGGGPACVGETGPDDWTDPDCDNAGFMPIAGAADLCGASGTEPPPGIGVCHQSFKVYTEGSAENMYNCLAMIGTQVAQACDDVAVQNCSTKVNTDACDTKPVQDACAGLVKSCTDLGDMSLDETYCNFMLRPFNDTALADVEACINAATEGDCKTTVDTCWDQVTTG